MHIFNWENLPMTVIVSLVAWAWFSFFSVILAG